jgi:hypothetical protein
MSRSLTRPRSHIVRHQDTHAMPVRLAAALAALFALPTLAADSVWTGVRDTARGAVLPPSPVQAPPSRGALATFPDLAAFQAATAAMDIVSEDFSARPANNVSPCYEPVNHQLGQPGAQFNPPVCFDPGTLVPGFSIRSNTGYLAGFGTMAFGAGSVGLPVPVVGAMSPATRMLIDFDHGPVAVAMDAWDWQAGSPLTFEVFDHDDALIGSFTLFPPSPQQSVFAGFVSEVPVKRITVAGAAGASQMISALHFGGRAGVVEAVTTEVDFGAVGLADVAFATVELRNGGDVPVAVGTLPSLPSGSPFTVTGEECDGAVLGAGETCMIDLGFAPELRSIHALRWPLLAAGEGQPAVEVMLRGRGALPMLLADATEVDFGEVATGGSATATVTLRSIGAVPVTLQAIGSITPPFSIQGHDCGAPPSPLAPGETCTLTLRFNAASPAPAYGFVRVGSSDPSSPTHVRLIGNGNDAIFVNGFESP